MKRQIRRGVYETNSSSTHSLTMCSEEEFEQWKNGELLFDKWGSEPFVKANSLSDDERNMQHKTMKITKMNFLKIGQTCQNLRKKSIIPNMQKRTIL